MSATRSDPSVSSETLGHAAGTTFESLAERLREGPLRTLLTLHVRAGVLAVDADADDRQRLEKLVELVQLAQMAMAQFRDFTLELQSLIDHLQRPNDNIR
jgi:hypothetical protein